MQGRHSLTVDGIDIREALVFEEGEADIRVALLRRPMQGCHPVTTHSINVLEAVG